MQDGDCRIGNSYNFECWLNKASSENFEKDYRPYGKREGLLDGV